jgi:tetratricopeptide (TPR) repeat protein
MRAIKLSVMQNLVRESSLCTCLFLGAAMAAMGQSRQENLNNCQSVDPDAKIAGCTALLKTDQDATKNRAVIYGSRGVGYYGKDDYDRAIQDTDQAIRLNPNEPSFYYTSGLAYKKKGDYDRAIQEFSEAIRLNPNFERAYYDRGNAYIDKEEYDRAIQEFNEAIRLNANNANNYNNRGVAYKRKGDYGRSIQDYNQAIRLNSNDTISYFNRGDAYFAQSNLTAAIADFEYTISAAPSSSAAVSAALLLHVIMKRQGHDDAQQLARVAAVADLSKWPGPMLKLDFGQMTASEVMIAAASPSSDRQKRWRVCEANYFTGEDALLRHQRTVALAHLKAARDGCPHGLHRGAGGTQAARRIGFPGKIGVECR